MTKDPKLTRITDSASSGMEESMATEIRSTKWTASEPLDYDAHSTRGFIEVSAPNDACFTALFPLRKDAEDYIAWKESGPECSRLASRVEELEKVLGDLVKAAGHTHRCDFKACSCGRVEGFKVALGEATRLLAGAHAEEKE